MDKVYHTGIGDRLIYSEEGRNIEVLDFLGGFGASLFGHNHPELVRVAQAGYQDNMPFNAQASCRGNASMLAEKLDHMMFSRTGKHYISIFGNSGTESVEAALKHAEFHQFNRIYRLHDAI
jgi:acetylornithine/succinyldiaminopimelate/putrescine aminotransferase